MSAPEFRLTHGASVEPDGRIRFSVWAPRVQQIEVELVATNRRIPLVRGEQGVHHALAVDVPVGSDYFLVLERERRRPDPVSRHQPSGVHGPTRIVDPAAFRWSDRDWKGVALEELLIYELHVGTFTPEGTFDAAIERLDHLGRLGVTAIELMPVAEFPGERNWGYDGVHPYAPQSSYGGPEGLKRLIDACHAAGLAVILDVVYNHIGPEGNYLPELAAYFSDRYRTPWGEALNFDTADSDPVRRYFIENALYWLTEFHVDGLRLDAIHAIYDFSAEHVLAELSEQFQQQAKRLGRRAWLIAESDLNDTRVTRPASEGGFALDAQWSDDFHHSLFSALTGARHGYFADFGALGQIAKALREGFVYDGQHSRFRRRRHGSSARSRPGRELVVFAQNHDQIANASHGHRISQRASPAAQRLATVVLLCAPNLILLFQGQEWGETAPFHYFTSHSDPALAREVSEGRKREFVDFGASADFRDPQSVATFLESRLDWDKLGSAEHAALLRLHQRMIELRKSTPALSSHRKDLTRCRFDDQERWLVLERSDGRGSRVLVLANFDQQSRAVPLPPEASLTLLLSTSDPAFWAGATAHPPAPEQLGRLERLSLPAESAALYRIDSD
jgi:maltooligosyltrehalose trehalohydrolase